MIIFKNSQIKWFEIVKLRIAGFSEENKTMLLLLIINYYLLIYQYCYGMLWWNMLVTIYTAWQQQKKGGCRIVKQLCHGCPKIAC